MASPVNHLVQQTQPDESTAVRDYASAPLLQLRSIRKTFPGVMALKGVDFVARRGEVHALMGENGAGKSTLIKVLTGAYPRDAGTMLLEGKPIDPRSPMDAQRLGISTVYQEVNLIPTLSVAENIFLGRQPRSWLGIRWTGIRQCARRALARLSLDIDVGRQLSTYSIAIQQMVAIARALDVQAKLLVLDEPTSSLDAGEVRQLFEVMRQLRTEGLGIIFVSHFLDQIYQISDRITVLRNGQLVGEYMTRDLPRAQLVSRMMGRELAEFETQPHPASGEMSAPAAPPLLRARNLGRSGAIEPLDLDIHAGQVAGLAGLLGSGRTETARLLFGVDRADSGQIEVDGKPASINSPRQAIRHGFGFCPEDRKTSGIVADLSVRENIVLALAARNGVLKSLSREEQDQIANRYIGALGIATPHAEQAIKNLSGGNQQKAILARWLASQPRLLILDEPTRGIDVGAKAQIQKLILSLVDQGMAILFISSELEEVVRVCDRVTVLRDRGKIAELIGEQVSEQSIMQAIAHDGAAAVKKPGSVINEESRSDSPPPVLRGRVREGVPPDRLMIQPPPQLSPGLPGEGVSPVRIAAPTGARRQISSSRAPLLWPVIGLGLLLIFDLFFVPNFFRISVVDGRLAGTTIEIFRWAGPEMLLAVGMTLVLATGGVDLSVGATMALAGSVIAALATQQGWPPWLAILAALVVSLIAGAWNGALVTTLEIQPIVATLVLMVAGRGIAERISGAAHIAVNGKIFTILGGSFAGLPTEGLVGLAVFLIAAAFCRMTSAGLLIEATGGNPTASRFAGVNVRAITFLVYLFCGFCAGLAGVLKTSDLQGADASQMGLYWELDAILAAVIGGTALTGGRFSLLGAVLGAWFIVTLTTTIQSKVDVEYALVAKAVVVLTICLLQSESFRTRILKLASFRGTTT